ncbi:PepSY-associated TM helix domain-containing protein [Pseudozobellia thermophila]|uniref:PepSY-associated TM region n=1 Tax=Pseudozobellia thermophila TaxID=192903 RepID=A0A1M6HDY0_9FLAO|nr:PepSY-associated TM helix domain-containing protein [Pseudozobellia thermophila]SHJ20349.1 PepSY-associated TM region [Pseudozobellia thermophila]
MKRRIYNILFHTHTVSGIVISVALYVIFFAGSFSFFRDEIVSWERGHHVEIWDQIPEDIDAYLEYLQGHYDLKGREVEISHYYNERNINVSLSASKDSLAPEAAKARKFFYLDTEDFTASDYKTNYGLGEFLYRLHFLDQIPRPYGRYLSGFVALFFLFALLTGIWIHWDKIVSNFYVFRPWAKLKTLWTDAHTALGLIGFPFQFVYALTGAFFLLKGILILPNVMALYGGDQKALFKDLEYAHPEYEYTYTPLETAPKINTLLKKTLEDWEDFKPTEVHIFNYGDANMHVAISGNLDYREKFNGYGYRIFRWRDQAIVDERIPRINNRYLDGVKNALFRLHLGDYGGLGLRVLSFILGLMSCVVILSGIMIWLVARDKKKVPEKKRRFNAKVANIYMAICLSMFPITALTFIAVKLHGSERGFIYGTYFIGWLVLSILFSLKKDIGFTNKWCLVAGGALSLLVPLANGFKTGLWPWVSFSKGYGQILLVDLLFALLGLISLWVVFLRLPAKSAKIPKTP